MFFKKNITIFEYIPLKNELNFSNLFKLQIGAEFQQCNGSLC